MDGVLSNVVGPIISKLAELTITPIGRQFGYMFYYYSNLENLRAGVEELRGTKSRVDAFVAGAERKGNLVHDEVRTWLAAVSKLNEDVESLVSQQVGCLELKSRFRMSKKAYKMKLNHVDMLQTKGEKFTEDNVSYPAPPPPLSASFPGDAVPFRSRDSIRDKILEALKKDDVKVLGIHGMGGVGKTTLIQEMAKRAEAMNLFDEILMAVVSQDLSIRKIQDQFASKLGLSLGDDKESDTVRAGRLQEKLEKTGNVLVILDDLWKHLDLQAVGIPSPDKHKCCKIVITTREKDVCDQMDCKNNTFSVMVLSEGEGWHLFKKMAGDCVTSAEVEPVAIEVAKECGGLPLAIVVVARALKDKNPTRWKHALGQLQASAPTNIKGMHKDVYSRLQLSYNYLDGKEIKHFFLLFSLFPEDYAIPKEWLFRYGVGLGLFHQAGLGGTMQKARVVADSFVDILESACLLSDSDRNGTIRVHDVVRDFCLSSIASTEQLQNITIYRQSHVFLAKSGWKLTEWPEIDCSTDYTAISLVGNNIEQFHRGLDCPKLKFFLFLGKHQEVNIADSFFETTKELKVLHISRVRIPLFPPSQGLLGKLRTLHLERCALGEMEMIGDLKGLEVLSLSGSRFKGNKLPMGISQLTRLRLLDLSHCWKLFIPGGILSNLSRLEELYLDDSFNEWEKESEEEFYTENSGRGERYASLSELESSSHSLTTLMAMRVEDVRLLPKDLFFPKLTTFRIHIGDDLFYDKNYSLSKAGLKVDFKGSSRAKDHGICSLMQRCECLQLSRMVNMKTILYDINKDGFPNLKILVVKESNDIEEIITSEECEAIFPQLKYLRLCRLPKLKSFCDLRRSRKPMQLQPLFRNKVVFPCLEELILQGLHEVETIWHSDLPNESFLQLKGLTVSSCEKVLKIVPAYMHPRLPKLQFLHVHCCASAEEIFQQHDHSTVTGGESPKLTRAHLYNNLTELYIVRCDSLTSLFQPSMAKCLVKLQRLEVLSCLKLETIIGEEEEEAISGSNLVFPQLNYLNLRELQNIRCFCENNLYTLELPSVSKMFLSRCPKMKTFSSAFAIAPNSKQIYVGNNSAEFEEYVQMNKDINTTVMDLFLQQVVFPCLEELILQGLQVENIWHSDLTNESFQQLKELCVIRCEKVLKIIPAYMHPRLPELQSLVVKSCDLVEEIFEQQDHSIATGGELPKLTHAHLYNNLTHLHIQSCNSLTSLFQPSMAKSLVKLEKLGVMSCLNMETIIGEEEEEAISGCSLVFPQLNSLQLVDLQNIRCFCEDKLYTLEFPSLSQMLLSMCPKMKTFSSASATAPSLKQIYVGDNFREYVQMNKDINTTVMDLFLQQDEIESDGAGCSISQVSEE